MCLLLLQEVPGEALLPGDVVSICRPKGGPGAEDKVVPAGTRSGMHACLTAQFARSVVVDFECLGLLFVLTGSGDKVVPARVAVAAAEGLLHSLVPQRRSTPCSDDPFRMCACGVAWGTARADALSRQNCSC
jgi:hypothetical protein